MGGTSVDFLRIKRTMVAAANEAEVVQRLRQKSCSSRSKIAQHSDETETGRLQQGWAPKRKSLETKTAEVVLAVR